MSEILVPIAFWLIVLFPFGVFIWQIRRVRRGTVSKGRGALLFLFYSATPIIAYVVAFLVLVALEEIANVAIIMEGYARSLLLIAGIGVAWVLLMTAVFTMLAAFLNRTRT
jgi:hypothetical protein